MKSGDFLTIDQAAEYLCISSRSVKRLMAARSIPFIKMGRRIYRFRRQTLEQWVINKETNSKSK